MIVAILLRFLQILQLVTSRIEHDGVRFNHLMETTQNKKDMVINSEEKTRKHDVNEQISFERKNNFTTLLRRNVYKHGSSKSPNYIFLNSK